MSSVTALPRTKTSEARAEDGWQPDWLPHSLFPFRSRFVEIDGARLHYVDEGAGPTLLLLHGSPMWSFMYRKLIAELRGRYRCIAVDLPGLGLSTAPLRPGRAFSENAQWLGAFLDQLALVDVTLVAHATAVPSALQMVLDRRRSFRSLVISNGFAWPLEGDRKLETIVRMIGSGPFAFANVHLNFLGRLTGRLGRRGSRFTSDERAAIVGPFHAKATRRHLQNILGSIRSERRFFAQLHARLETLAELPMLLLYGVHDNGYRAGFLDRWQDAFPRHQTVLLPESGHFPLEDEPARFIDALSDWRSRS